MRRLLAKLSMPLLAVMLGGCVSTRPGATGGNAAPPASELPVSGAAASAKVHVDLGMAYFQIARYAVALDEARTALVMDPNYSPTYHLMALVYMYIDDMPSARENFQRALSMAPNDPEYNNSYGWFQCVNGNFSDGLERLAIAARNPYYRTPTRPYTNAGLCYLAKGDEAAAETELRRAVQLDPSNRSAIYQLAGIAYRRGAYEVANTYLVQLHQEGEPTAASAWLGLRTARRLGNRDAEASYAAQLRGRFADSPEFQAMTQGKYE
ncbi:type IV pilus biogenesis/stability protein PilW [Azoarcus sp. KH32C]|uniref:type IV pilus biogenesis/stability protein PilW n=1 Tax=Azoarcus sp. KH32C TaxID=748247 RepID=UPI00023866C3|nr:type IV pilus biogenesis/stability protein PilW [Azoarcus sp. KH32C]BAL23143.1 type IV fimbrial biogenesis protein [Azoarcus sp. KH32C]